MSRPSNADIAVIVGLSMAGGAIVGVLAVIWWAALRGMSDGVGWAWGVTLVVVFIVGVAVAVIADDARPKGR